MVRLRNRERQPARLDRRDRRAPYGRARDAAGDVARLGLSRRRRQHTALRAPRGKRTMKYAWLVIAVFAARFLVVAVAYPAVDGDLAWQRWFGAAVLRTGSIPQSLGPETFTAP